MSRKVAGVFYHALVFGMAPFLQKGIAALLLPYFTHYLSPGDYGLRDLLVTITGLYPVLFGFEHRVGFIRRYVALEDGPERRRLFSATMLFTLASAALAVLFFLAAFPALHLIWPEAQVGPAFLAILAAGIFIDLINLMLLAAIQANLWSGRMVILNLVQFALGVVLAIGFVAGLRLGALGLFLANTCASALALAGLLWIARGLFTRALGPGRTWSICRPQLLYSLPLWGGSLAYFALRNVDRVLISRLDSLAVLGVYGMAWKLSNLLVSFVLVPFQKSFDVWRFKLYEEGEDPGVIAQVLRWFMLVSGLLALGLATAGVDLFVALADPAYAGVGRYLPWLNLAVLLQCGYSVTNSSFFVTARTGAWVQLFLAATALQIFGCWVLVVEMGPIGAPFALVATNAFLYLGSHLRGRHLWPVPYEHGQTLGCAALATLLSLARPWVEVRSLGLALGLDAFLVAVFLAIALASGWVRAVELRSALDAVRDKWARIRHKMRR